MTQNFEFLSENGIETNKWGEIIASEEGQTTVSNVFTGGDCYRGSDLVVTAAADGKRAATKIAEMLLK